MCDKCDAYEKALQSRYMYHVAADIYGPEERFGLKEIHEIKECVKRFMSMKDGKETHAG